MVDQFNFADEINGFSRVEYLSVFMALLYAFVIAEFFIGWGKMLRHKDSIVFSTHHLLWSFVFFWGSILNWYIFWPRLAFVTHGFLYFAVILLPILLFFFAVTILFPDFEKVRDMRVYYEKNQRIIVFLVSFTLFINVLIGVVMRESHWLAPPNLLRGTISVFGMLAAGFNRKGLQDIVLYVFLVSIILGTVIVTVAEN